MKNWNALCANLWLVWKEENFLLAEIWIVPSRRNEIRCRKRSRLWSPEALNKTRILHSNFELISGSSTASEADDTSKFRIFEFQMQLKFLKRHKRNQILNYETSHQINNRWLLTRQYGENASPMPSFILRSTWQVLAESPDFELTKSR